MTRPLALALLLTAMTASDPLGAQSPARPGIPDTPAGAVLRAWLEAFNGADTTRLAAYLQRYEPQLTVASQLPFREQTGGFDLLSVERSEPRRIEFLVRERKGPTTAYGAITLSDGEPATATTFLRAIGPNASASQLRIDAARRRRVVEGAIAQLERYYVFPDVAKRMGDAIRAKLAAGAYDSYANGMSFALRLTEDLREVSKDKHLRLGFSARPLPPEPAGGPRDPSPEDRERERREMEGVNCGFEKAELLPGNVGYLKFDFFGDPGICGPTAAAAMNFLAGARALIVDLRENGGGDPAMVAYVSSYLFATRTHLNDLWNRETGRSEEYWTRDDVPGRRFGGEKPVYVLTSARTFSGAEEFAYNLKSLKRATIVGETTGGGAHPVSGRRIDENFTIGVPFARAINPVTKTNWEGTGVEPDVKVPAAESLATAQRLLREPGRP